MKKEEKECQPEPVEIEDKFHSADYNCNECDQSDCFYWHIYHPDIDVV